MSGLVGSPEVEAIAYGGAYVADVGGEGVVLVYDEVGVKFTDEAGKPFALVPDERKFELILLPHLTFPLALPSHITI